MYYVALMYAMVVQVMILYVAGGLLNVPYPKLYTINSNILKYLKRAFLSKFCIYIYNYQVMLQRS